MGTKFWEVVCDEHGIGGSGEYCGDNEAHLDRVNVFYHEEAAALLRPSILSRRRYIAARINFKL